MTCFFCKGKVEDKLTNFISDLDNCIVIVRNVPSQVCKQCGEVSYSYEVAQQLEKIVHAARAVVSDIAVVDYNSKVA